MGRYRLVIPPHVADVIRRLRPDLKRSVRNALRALGDDPSAGWPLRRELERLWKFRVRRFWGDHPVAPSRALLLVASAAHPPALHQELAARRLRPSRANAWKMSST